MFKKWQYAQRRDIFSPGKANFDAGILDVFQGKLAKYGGKRASVGRVDNFQTGPSENAHKSMNALRKFALAVHKNFLSAHHKKSSIKTCMLSALLDSNLRLALLHFL